MPRPSAAANDSLATKVANIRIATPPAGVFSHAAAHSPRLWRSTSKRCIGVVVCFETRPRALLSMRKSLMALTEIPHPEEAAQRLSRRTHNADPVNRQLPSHASGAVSAWNRLSRAEIFLIGGVVLDQDAAIHGQCHPGDHARRVAGQEQDRI